jgi:hypothetical protein
MVYAPIAWILKKTYKWTTNTTKLRSENGGGRSMVCAQQPIT